MRQVSLRRPLSLVAVAATACLPSGHAAAAPGRSTIAAIESRIRALQAEIAAVKRDAAHRRAATLEAQRTATEAQAEAREATRRANALQQAELAGRTSFGGPFTVSQSPAPGSINGVGSHFLGTVGQQKASSIGEGGRFQLGGVSVQLGGFIDATAIVRSRNMVADVTSNWQSIPTKNSALYHEPEFRGSARSSRLALLIEGQPSSVTRVAGYFEADFKTAGVSSNSNESNSYAMGLRHAYLTVDRNDSGLHVLAGQSWSLLTLDRVGITPRQEQIPLTIDNAYLPGFNWDRNWQLRFVESFLDRRLWAGLSLESPLTTYYVNNANSTGVIGGTPNTTNPGGSLLNSTANYSDDIAPDIVAKLAYDPSFGHYELDGVARFMHDRVTSTIANRSGRDNTVLAGGVGGGLILPIIGPRLTVQASGLVGQGIGRYGEAQFPDATISSNGNPLPLPEVQALLGMIYHPTRQWDLYAYVGTEQVAKRSYNEVNGRTLSSFGYGNGYYSDAGCNTEGSALACVANTRGLTQGTLGAWWRFLHGPFGTLQVGSQWSYTQRTAFSGTGATRGSIVTPKTDDNIVMFSFRYLPFL
jgi:hypothetical protein